MQAFYHRRSFSSTTARQADFTHAVIGAGAVGLAVARRLQQIDGAQVVLIEKHGMVGSETSSRNSEVCGIFRLHSNLQFPKHRPKFWDKTENGGRKDISYFE